MEKPAREGQQPLTTFVQADTNTFRELVQRLTGPSDGDSKTSSSAVPQVTEAASAFKVAGVKRPTFKLHERRQYTRSKLEIVKPGFLCKPGSSIMSPSEPSLYAKEPVFSSSKCGNSCFATSPLSTPSITFSNLSIFQEEKEKPSSSELNGVEEEEKAIKERRFYLHPSPRSRSGNAEPELLALFPLTSPKTRES